MINFFLLAPSVSFLLFYFPFWCLVTSTQNLWLQQLDSSLFLIHSAKKNRKNYPIFTSISLIKVRSDLKTPNDQPMTSNDERKIITQLGKSYFPESIPIFKVRHDRKGHELTRGDVHHKLQNKVDDSNKNSTYQHFAHALQCAVHEPDFNDINGAINLLRMVPPSIESLEYCCTYAETRCTNHHGQNCRQYLEAFKNGDYPESLGVYQLRFNGFEQVVLMRVKDNVLYYDWPWGRHRIQEYQQAHNNGSTLQPVTNENYQLMIDTLRLVHVDDSVFMMGAEQPSLPWLLPPFPSFSFAPKLSNSEMPWPWPESYHRLVSSFPLSVSYT